MKETILKDGEIAFLSNGVEIIMNDNTLLGLMEKLGLLESEEESEEDYGCGCINTHSKPEEKKQAQEPSCQDEDSGYGERGAYKNTGCCTCNTAGYDSTAAAPGDGTIDIIYSWRFA